MTNSKAPQSTNAPKAKKNQASTKPASVKTTKTDQLIDMLARPDGASIAEMSEATGWQSHSVRGTLAGALRKKGIEVTSDVTDGTRRYRIGALA